MANKSVVVSDLWEVMIPEGFIYCTDKKIIGSHRNIIIMEDKKGNVFSDPFGASISFTSQEVDGNGAGILLAHQMFDMLFHGTKTIIKDDARLYVAHSFEGRETFEDGDTQDKFVLYVATNEKLSSIQVCFNNSDMFVLDQVAFLDKFAKSIRPVMKKGYKEKDGLKELNFSNGKEVTIENRLVLPIPDGFHYSTNKSVITEQRRIVVVPERYKLGEDPNEAPYALTILANEINLGSDFREEYSDQIEDMFTEQLPVFQKGLYIGKVVARDGLGIFYQSYYGDPDRSWNKIYAVALAKEKAYIISFMYNHPGIDGSKSEVSNYFVGVCLDWLEKIRLKGEKKIESEDYYEDNQKEEGTSMYFFSNDGEVTKFEKTEGGIKAVASKKSSGNAGRDIKALDSAAKRNTRTVQSFETELVPDNRKKLINGDKKEKYAVRYVPVSAFIDGGKCYDAAFNYYIKKYDPDFYEIVDKNYAAAEKYLEIFDKEEQEEIRYGYLKNTAPIHALRSFIWTAVELKDAKNRGSFPDDLSSGTIAELAEFIKDRGYANYGTTNKKAVRFGALILQKEEVKSEFYKYLDPYNENMENSINSYINNAAVIDLYLLAKLESDLIPPMDVLFDIATDNEYEKYTKDAAKEILKGWSLYAFAGKQPFLSLPIKYCPAESEMGEVIKSINYDPEIKELDGGRYVIADGSLVECNDERRIITIPDEVKTIARLGGKEGYASYFDKAETLTYPKGYKGEVYVPEQLIELNINSDIDVLHVTKTPNWLGRDHKLRTLNINGKITKLSPFCMSSFYSLINVKLPDSLKTIGSMAFGYDDSLKSITLPEGIKEIESRAFYDCPLSSVTIPSSVDSIGNNAFYKWNFDQTIKVYKGSYGCKWAHDYVETEKENVDYLRISIVELEPIWITKAREFSSKISAEYASSVQANDINSRITDIINNTLMNDENYSKGKNHIISNIYSDELDLVKKTVQECETIDELKAKLPSLLAEDIPKVKREKEIKKTKNLITEKKLQISRLEKEISEKEEKIKNYEKEIDENQQMLSSKESSLGYDLGNKKFQLTTNLNGQKAVIFKLEEKIKEIEILIENTSKELEDAGFFKFSLKKELNAKIDSLNSEIAKIRENLKSESTKLDEITKEYSELVEKPSAELESLKSKVSNLIFTKRQISASIDSAKKSIEDYRGEILRLEERLNKYDPYKQ